MVSVVLMIHSLNSTKNNVLANGDETQMMRIQATQRKATKTILGLLALYFLLYIPAFKPEYRDHLKVVFNNDELLTLQTVGHAYIGVC